MKTKKVTLLESAKEYFGGRDWLEIGAGVGVVLTVGLAIIMWATFWGAVMNGGQITVYINSLGEMQAEIVLMLTIFPVALGLTAFFGARALWKEAMRYD